LDLSIFLTGSIKLRSYAGRSLFNGLLTAPAARKRAGVVDVLDSFPDSQFFLIGDTGEQDLELYAESVPFFFLRIVPLIDDNIFLAWLESGHNKFSAPSYVTPTPALLTDQNH